MLLIKAKDDRLYGFDIDEIKLRLDRFQEAVHHSKTKRSVIPVINKLETRLRSIFKKQGNDILDRFGVMRSFFKEADLIKRFDSLFSIGISDTSVDMLDELEKSVREALLLGGQTSILDFGLGIDFDLKNPLAINWLRNYGAEEIAEINETSRDRIHTVLNDAIDRGWSYSRTAQSLKELYEDFSTYRAKVIATTEVGNAYQEGNLQAVKSAQTSGLTFEKSWLTVGDKRVSDVCKKNNSAGWIAVDAKFPSGHERPLSHPNCRCVLQMRRMAEKKPAQAVKSKPATVPSKPKIAVAAPKSVEIPKPSKPVLKQYKGFALNKADSYKNVSSALGDVFPNTTTHWSGKAYLSSEINYLGLHDRSTGIVWINQKAVDDPRKRDEVFKAITHELLHTRSRGGDWTQKGQGWEEGVIERNAQLKLKDIAKSVGYNFENVKAAERSFNKHPYSKFFLPLSSVIKESGANEEAAYAEMLPMTCAERQTYIQNLLVKKFGSSEGKRKFQELDRKMK